MSGENRTNWIERIIISVIATVLAGGIFGLYNRQLEAERWRGQMEERIDNSIRTMERIEQKILILHAAEHKEKLG
jgi:hypothetical protein